MATYRILIVEDESVVAADIEAQLSNLGYETVSPSMNGENALASIERHKPDLVLMDIHLQGGMDGIETAQEIRRRFRTPVVFLTAYAEDETLERAKSAEPYGYILKPFQNRDLRTGIEIALSRRAAEEALRESEERFRQLAANTEEVFWIGSPDRTELFYVSPAYERIWGRTCRSLHENPRSWMDAVIAEDREAAWADIQRRMGGDYSDPVGPECRIERPDGSRRWIQTRVYPIRDERGGIYRVAGIVQDISERRHREAVMAARLRLLEFANTHTMHELLVATLDEAEALTESRMGFCHFLEADQNSVTFQAWSTNTTRNLCRAEGGERHHPLERAGVWAECIRCRRPVIHNDYMALPDRKGLPPGHAAVERELTVPVLRGARITAVIGVGNKPTEYGPEDVQAVSGLADLAWDIAERKRAEESLRESERAVAALMGNMPGMAYRCRNDPSWTMEFVSEGCLNLCGFTPADLVGNAKASYAALMHPDDRKRVRDEVQKAVERQQQYRLTYRIVTRAGSTKWVWEQGTAVQSATGGPAVLEGFISDITERKELEAKLLHARKMEAFGQLAGGMAHDFNNILASTMIHLSLLSMRPDLDAEIRRSILELQGDSARGASLTRQLLLFSRRTALETKPLDLNEVVTNISKILGRLIGEHIELRFARGMDLPRIEADAGMLEQVLMNLAVNSRDAMPKGGRIVIATMQTEMDAEQAAMSPDRRPGRFLRLSVSDTGHGMDAATMERIFEPFFTTKEAGKGTGMGLATVHGIVAQHKGWIEVESAVGRGTTFRLYFPVLSGARADPAALAIEEETIPQGHETILLVEDEQIVRSMIVESLSGLGYRIIEAADGQEAMELWRKHGTHVDLLLTDMVMPNGMNGIELAERLQTANPQLKVIISSGYSAEIAESGASWKKGVSFLPKPYDLPRLARLVRECIEGEAAPS